MTIHNLAIRLSLLGILSAGMVGCGGVIDENAELSDGTEEAALGGCYCAAPYTCGHSSSPTYMFNAAHAAALASGVSDAALIQTFGDAPASVGTHCPEPGTAKSAATDINPGASPCERVHRLRMAGFAAWYRTPPLFGYHIHAVWAAAPVLKSSLKNQIASFEQGRNGLVSNARETTCPITQAEIDAVKNGGSGGGGGGASCFPGGSYCGGDKIAGDPSTLYRCNADGSSTTVIRHCTNGCSVNPGRDDSCR